MSPWSLCVGGDVTLCVRMVTSHLSLSPPLYPSTCPPLPSLHSSPSSLPPLVPLLPPSTSPPPPSTSLSGYLDSMMRREAKLPSMVMSSSLTLERSNTTLSQHAPATMNWRASTPNQEVPLIPRQKQPPHRSKPNIPQPSLDRCGGRVWVT